MVKTGALGNGLDVQRFMPDGLRRFAVEGIAGNLLGHNLFRSSPSVRITARRRMIYPNAILLLVFQWESNKESRPTPEPV
jgi:hypothetical protein